MSNMTDLWPSGVFFQPPKIPKLAFGPWDTPSPIPSSLDAFGVSISAPRLSALPPSQHKFLATPICLCSPSLTTLQTSDNHCVHRATNARRRRSLVTTNSVVSQHYPTVQSPVGLCEADNASSSTW